jgi:hypothetical protein
MASEDLSPSGMTRSMEFNARYSRAHARFMQWLSILEASFYYAVPFRNRFYRDVEYQGAFNNARLYDLTAVEATNSFVSKIHTVMTPPQVQWGYLVVNDSDPNLDEETRTEAQKILSNYMREVFKYIHRSNFDVSVGETYFDLAVGTSCLVCNAQADFKNPLLYTSIPVDQLAIEESIDGKVRSWFRTWKQVRVDEINLRWPEAVINDDLRQSIVQGPNATTRLVEGVTYHYGEKYPYRYSLYNSPGGGTGNGAAQGSGIQGGKPLFEKELEINPGIVWRFQKTNNEWWGRGPVMFALPAIMRANEMAKIEFASANLNVFRPYMGFSDNVFNPHTFRLRPMAVIPIAPIGTNGQVPLIPLPDSSNPAFGQVTLADLRAQINNLMFADPLGPVDAPPRTATELVIRQQALAEKIGPLFTRLQQEFLWPILEVTMHHLDKLGLVAKPQLNGADISFQYRSPLAFARGQQDLSIFTQYIQVIQGVMGPDVAQLLVNAEQAPWIIAEWLQMDMRLINTQPEMKAIAQQLKDKQNAMQAAAATQGQPPGALQ